MVHCSDGDVVIVGMNGIMRGVADAVLAVTMFIDRAGLGYGW